MAAALIICFLTPLVAYSVQTGGVSALFVAACMPTILMQVAMIMAVELPDYNADLLTGKSNLVVRLGLRRAALFHNALLLAAYLALAASATWGRPQPAVLSPLLSLPVAAVQAWLITRAARGDNGKIHAMTFTAIVLFAGFCLLQIAGIIVAGLERG
jgi:1,4-dihydroxy-2-naphthoate octaprenyltransferase